MESLVGGQRPAKAAVAGKGFCGLGQDAGVGWMFRTRNGPDHVALMTRLDARLFCETGMGYRHAACMIGETGRLFMEVIQAA